MNLPAVQSAKLPKTYEHAKAALAQCAKVDECKKWADKSAAMASYAKQADDKTLHNLATKIRARAIRRAGELLREVEPDKGGRPPKTSVGADPGFSRRDLAAEGGLSERQAKQAIRVASIPEKDFEAAVESDSPPTVEQLAKAGVQYRKAEGKAKPSTAHLRGATPEEFYFATQLFGALGRFVERTIEGTPTAAARGERQRRRELQRNAKAAIKWLERLLTALEKDEDNARQYDR